MKPEVVTSVDRFRQLESQWNRLLERNRHSSPFMTFEWLISYLEVFGESVQPLLIVVWEGDEIIGLAPLAINSRKHLVFIGYPHNDYADFIITGDTAPVMSTIWRTVLAHRGRYRRIVLDQWQETDSHWEDCQACLRQLGIPHRILRSDQCPAMLLDNIEAARKKYYKRNITTYINWYQKRGELKFDVATERGDALERLESLFRQHRERRDKTPFPSQFTNPLICSFYRKFVERLFDSGWILLAALKLDDEDLALYLALPFDRVMYLYTTSFDDSYAKRSPGQVILRYLFDFATERGFRQLDFARGDESYKNRFANREYQNRKIIIYRTAWSKVWADWFHSFRYSAMVDKLYRNRRVQSSLMTFLYYQRKFGLWPALWQSAKVMVSRTKN